MTEILVLFLARFTLGFFFVSYRFRWFWDPTPPDGVEICSPYRRMSLRKKLCACGWGADPFFAGMIAIGEVLAGIGLILGWETRGSAVALLMILLVATACTAVEKTMWQNPVDRIDVVNCYLWTPEPLYIVLSLVVLAFGPGDFSLDHWMGL